MFRLDRPSGDLNPASQFPHVDQWADAGPERWRRACRGAFAAKALISGPGELLLPFFPFRCAESHFAMNPSLHDHGLT